MKSWAKGKVKRMKRVKRAKKAVRNRGAYREKELGVE